MHFLIVTHTIHKKVDNTIAAYEPYVREMNLWLKNVDKVTIIAPRSQSSTTKIEAPYLHDVIELIEIPSLNFTSALLAFKSLLRIPYILYLMAMYMKMADHIHLRCPGNIGLLGCFAQVFFPNKKKTVKYAGNWDPNSAQPLSYRIQKKLLNSTSFFKNVKVLVYGNWKQQSKNIVPFFTATYKEKDKIAIANKSFDKEIRLLFVGALTKGKRPDLSLEVTEALYKKGYAVRLDVYGDGALKGQLLNHVAQRNLQEVVTIHGNVAKEEVKEAFRKSHFLLFISKSEGWPKVVAEAMFWKCLPLSSKVSCIPTMLADGERGSLIDPDKKMIVNEVIAYIDDANRYQEKVNKACDWSRTFTLDKFEAEIAKLVHEK